MLSIEEKIRFIVLLRSRMKDQGSRIVNRRSRNPPILGLLSSIFYPRPSSSGRDDPQSSRRNLEAHRQSPHHVSVELDERLVVRIRQRLARRLVNYVGDSRVKPPRHAQERVGQICETAARVEDADVQLVIIHFRAGSEREAYRVTGGVRDHSESALVSLAVEVY